MAAFSFKKRSDARGFDRVNSQLMAELSHDSIEKNFRPFQACYSIQAFSPVRYSMFALYYRVTLTLDEALLSLRCQLRFWVLVPGTAALSFTMILLLKQDLRFNDVLVLLAFAFVVTGFALLSSYIRVRTWFNRAVDYAEDKNY